MHKTLTNRGRYTITWNTAGDESGLLHYALPHQQVGTGLPMTAFSSAFCRLSHIFSVEN